MVLSLSRAAIRSETTELFTFGFSPSVQLARARSNSALEFPGSIVSTRFMTARVPGKIPLPDIRNALQQQQLDQILLILRLLLV